MNTKKLFITIFVLVLVLAISNIVYAACSQYGKVFKIYTYYSGSTQYATIYLRYNSTTSYPHSYNYYFITNKPGFIDICSEAQSAENTVRLYGNASSCPTSGTLRYGGYISNVYVYSEY